MLPYFQAELVYNPESRPERVVRNHPEWKYLNGRMQFVEPETDLVLAYWDIDEKGLTERVFNLTSIFEHSFAAPKKHTFNK